MLESDQRVTPVQIRHITGGDPQLLARVSPRATMDRHPLDDLTTTMQIQTSVSGGHEEDLWGEWVT